MSHRLRIRTIKPELWDSDDFNSLSPDGRLVFLWLIGHVDDEGRMAASGRFVAQSCSLDHQKVERQLRKMTTRGMIDDYQVDNRRYLALRNWRKHQWIGRPSKSELPVPPSGEQEDLPLDIGSGGGRGRGGKHRPGGGRQIDQDSGMFQINPAPRAHPGPGSRGVKGGLGYEGEGEGGVGGRGSGSPGQGDHRGEAGLARSHSNGYAAFIDELNQATGRHFKGDRNSETRYRVLLRDGYDPTDLVLAARGAGISPFHRGENAEGTPFQDPITVLRSRALQTLIDYGKGALQPRPQGLRQVRDSEAYDGYLAQRQEQLRGAQTQT